MNNLFLGAFDFVGSMYIHETPSFFFKGEGGHEFAVVHNEEENYSSVIEEPEHSYKYADLLKNYASKRDLFEMLEKSLPNEKIVKLLNKY
jgi:hypothetical protein